MRHALLIAVLLATAACSTVSRTATDDSRGAPTFEEAQTVSVLDAFDGEPVSVAARVRGERD